MSFETEDDAYPRSQSTVCMYWRTKKRMKLKLEAFNKKPQLTRLSRGICRCGRLLTAAPSRGIHQRGTGGAGFAGPGFPS